LALPYTESQGLKDMSMIPFNNQSPTNTSSPSSQKSSAIIQPRDLASCKALTTDKQVYHVIIIMMATNYCIDGEWEYE
jgi:hypothetical protein